jgi:amidase
MPYVCERAMVSAELGMQGVGDVVALLDRRELSAVELTKAMLARIERLDSHLHSYLTVTPERALAAAAEADRELAHGRRRGPLHGIPIGIKDLCATRGVRTTCASGVFADVTPDYDATVVRRLDAAGAVMLGKLNLTEFALMGYHPTLPRPRNPWNARHDTGGSSSGSGAALAAGLCFAAIGTDTGGSIRLPSAWCGVVGIKPTYGRVSRFGVFPLAASLDHVGSMARRVADAAAMLDAIAGPDPQDPTSLPDAPPRCLDAIGAPISGIRIGCDIRFMAEGAHPEVVSAVQRALGVLADLGAHIVEVTIPPFEELVSGWPIICAADSAAAHAPTFPSRRAEYGPTFRSFLDYAATLRAQDYAAAHEKRLVWSGQLRAMFEHVDLFACPSMFMTAMPADLLDPYGPFLPDIAPSMRFVAPFDFSGSPTLSIPCGFTDEGLPHSLQLVARHGAEPLLCRVGHAYESATDWHLRQPPLT